MKIIVLGGDGYLGWPTALHLAARDHEVFVADNGLKRAVAAEYGCESLFTPPSLATRCIVAHDMLGLRVQSYPTDCTKFAHLRALLEQIRPDAIVHYAELPSAPFSMLGYSEAARTLNNNLNTTLALAHAVMEVCPDAHVIKLGTMGEYGTPSVPIHEGWLDHREGEFFHRFLYPAEPGSLYHVTKVQDTHLLWLYCRTAGLRVTDVMQGPVYGLTTPECAADPRLSTTFHYDDLFGTVINRFVAQALIGHPLTVYGAGGQTRGFINLRDVMRCIQLMCENPAAPGELRIVNQITSVHTVRELADLVVRAARQVGLAAAVRSVPNPRVEKEEHYFDVEARALEEMGLRDPIPMSVGVLAEFIEAVRPLAGGIREDRILPRASWRM